MGPPNVAQSFLVLWSPAGVEDGGGCVRTQGFAFTPFVVRSSIGTDLFRRRSHKQVFVLRLLVIMLSSGVAGAMRTGKALTNR